MKYIRVIIQDIDTDDLFKSLEFEVNYKFAFIDHCFMRLDSSGISSDSLKIREYIMNEWDCKDIIVIKKDAVLIGDVKQDKLIDQKEFPALIDAQEYISRTYPDYNLAFSFSRTGVQYSRGNIQIWSENIDLLGKSIEIGFENEPDAQFVLAKLPILGTLSKPLPEIIYEIINRP